MKKTASEAGVAHAYAARAQQLIRARGHYSHISVRAYGAHLVVEAIDTTGSQPLARLTHLRAVEFALSFRASNGRWEPMPFAGPLEQVTADLVDTLAPYLDRRNFSVEISGTDH